MNGNRYSYARITMTRTGIFNRGDIAFVIYRSDKWVSDVATIYNINEGFRFTGNWTQGLILSWDDIVLTDSKLFALVSDY